MFKSFSLKYSKNYKIVSLPKGVKGRNARERFKLLWSLQLNNRVVESQMVAIVSKANCFPHSGLLILFQSCQILDNSAKTKEKEKSKNVVKR